MGKMKEVFIEMKENENFDELNRMLDAEYREHEYLEKIKAKYSKNHPLQPL